MVYRDTEDLRLLQTDANIKAARLSLSVSSGERAGEGCAGRSPEHFWASGLEAEWELVALDAVCVGRSALSTWPGRLAVSQ